MKKKFLLLVFTISLCNVTFGLYEDCEVPPPVSFATIRLEESDDTIKAIYSCNPGYAIRGNIELICYFDSDEWNADPPSCVPNETRNEIIDEEKNKPIDQENNSRNKKKKVSEIAEDTSITEEFAANLDMSCVSAKIKAPEIRNGFVKRYDRRRKGENIFLAALYACNDNHELDDPERFSMYCSDRKWIGDMPNCVSVGEYEEGGEYDSYDETGGTDDDEDDIAVNEKESAPESAAEILPLHEQKENDKESMIINKIENANERSETTTEKPVTDINIIVEPTRDPYSPRVLNQSCDSEQTGCEQKCDVVLYPGENEPRFLCSCHPGFSLDPYNLQSCHDINECDSADIAERCPGGCENEPGSFKCHSAVTEKIHDVDETTAIETKTENQIPQSCQEGFRLDATGNCVDVDECEDGASGCLDICVNNVGSFECACQSGYRLGDDQRSCIDVNECELKQICSHECLNTLGSFLCLCEDNFHLLSDQKTCEHDTCDHLADPAMNKTRCSYDCVDSLTGGFQCTCPPDYELSSDQKTCTAVADACTDMGGSEKCSPGSCVSNENGNGYRCLCPPGFTDGPDAMQCKDIDECASETHECSHECHNLEGNYRCSCPTGFRMTDYNEHLCEDIDECASTTTDCEDLKCVNTVGGFQCVCPDGSETDANGRCKLSDPCEQNMGGCSHSCVGVDGKAVCQCPSDMVLSDDRHNCTILDICLLNNNGCDHICSTELQGKCSCRPGYQLANDGRSCIDYDECKDENGGCHQLCVNHQGSFACACEAGFKLQTDERTCSDVDECDLGLHDCSHFCVNIFGGYECSCPAGYELGQNKLSCVDIDECATAFCSHMCRNTVGSFQCECPEGYILDIDERNCLREDVCLNLKPDCSHFCENTNETLTGYRCLCSEGMLLGPDDLNCIDLDECEVDNGGCSHICINTEASFVCECPLGLKLAADQHSCEDINECLNANGGCSDYCHNTNGGFVCECDEGFFLDHDQLTCKRNDPCNENNGGCEQICTNHGNVAICSCRTGYEPALFEPLRCEDIDECQLNNGGCKFDCKNTIGSYECSCGIGFTKSLTGDCVDINECEYLNGGCIGGECVNFDGGYKCKCFPGQKLSMDGKTCIEIRDQCKQLPPLENGELQCTKFRHKRKLYYNTKCKVWCNTGYWLDGPSVRICNATGQWDDNENRCLPKICPRLPIPKYGVILPVTCSMGKTFMGERCRLQCLPGYIPIGKTTSVCTASQDWSTNDILDCILPPPTTRRPHFHISQNRQSSNGFRPYIKCPRNTTVYLSNGDTTAHIILQKPISNLDFRYIESYPTWSRNLEAYLTAGIYTITFRGLDPVSGLRAKCKTVITVRKVQPPKVTFCPPSFEVILAPGENYRAIFWDEPRFDDATTAAWKKIYKSQIPGSLFAAGVHRIYYEATNEEDLSSRCEFNIVVKNAHSLPQSQLMNFNFNYAHDPRSASYKIPNFMKDHESFLICPGQDPVKVQPGQSLQLPEGCVVKNIRLNPMHHYTSNSRVTKFFETKTNQFLMS